MTLSEYHAALATLDAAIERLATIRQTPGLLRRMLIVMRMSR